MPTHISWAAAGYLDIPSVCTGLTANNSLFICDPTATGLAGTFIGYADFNVISFFTNHATGDLQNQNSYRCPSSFNSEPCDNTPMWDWFAEVAKAGGGNATTSTYNLFEDQVTVAGRVYTDTMHVNTYSSKFIIGMVVIPIENFATPGVDSDYFLSLIHI